jgi:hypothetical protein
MTSVESTKSLESKGQNVGLFGTGLALLDDMPLFSKLALATALASALALGACAAEDGSSPSDERADLVEVIAYHQPEAPTVIEISDVSDALTSSHSISFGHCEEGEVGDDGAIHIACNEKWSEMAWLSISKEASQGLLDQGQTSLSFAIAITDSTAENESIRFAVHAVAEDGSTRKLASDTNVFDGESTSVVLEATEYYVYMARGKNSALIWHNGSVEVDLTTRSE